MSDIAPSVAHARASSTNTLNLIRARLEAHGRIEGDRGDSFMAQCPAHDDRTPSLSVSAGENGRALLHCFAGCELEQILAALGLDFPDLFPWQGWCDKGRDKGDAAPGCYKDKDEGKRREIEEQEFPPCNRPELYELIDLNERGEIEPAPVTLGKLPERATRDDKRVAADIAFLIGLRRADGDLRPLPYATRFCCRRMGWPENQPMRASRVLKRLERWGVVEYTASLGPRQGMAYRTRCYEPPLPAATLQESVAASPAVTRRIETNRHVSGQIDAAQPVGEEVGVIEAVANNSGVVPEVDRSIITAGDKTALHGQDASPRHGCFNGPSIADLTDHQLLAIFDGDATVEHVLLKAAATEPAEERVAA